MKKWLMGLTMISMAAGLFGCSNDNSSTGATTSVMDDGAGEQATSLKYWTFVELHGQHFQSMLKKWNEANPDRQIKLEVSVMPYDDMHNKLSIALQTGQGAPDISDIEVGKFPDFLNGTPQLESLNDVVEPYKDSIVKSRLDLYTKDGTVYGLPTHVGAAVAFYNTEILEEAGVDYKSIVTWDDYKKAGIQVYEKTGDYMGTADTSAGWQMSMMLAQQGKDFTDDSGKPVVNSPEMIKGLSILKDLQKSNVLATVAGGQPDTEEAYGEFNSGKYASAMMPFWFMSRFVNYMPDLSGKIAIAPIPVIEAGMPTSYGGGGTGTVVTKQAKDVQLAKDFLAYAKLTLDANINIWNTLGFDPVNTEVWTMDEVTHNKDNKFVQYFQNNPFEVLSEIKDGISLIKSTPSSPTLNNVLNTTTLNEIFESDADVTEAINEAQSQIEQQLK
ncbi:arabinosaccharide transport system substrate-binding protein [Paenibacillus phyllosphaerae]|uniref:Arabinosaccharide transport system substrate-binding protein n=1 Tax=Paenibacillus phyllosphaerae TaxID=274593 RepID=A0A7W5B3S2_9BACL|nr:ABC transporter substrate-binding protein [Paenibacillus phyllosphaerae]MBB3113895.1 arabinosaccharide transport system substrate-binding protein [Paenibacillus phyllosphaerae]